MLKRPFKVSLLLIMAKKYLKGSVSGSGTGPLDSQATDPVPDPETLL